MIKLLLSYVIMIFLLFPEKTLNLILGVAHESHAGPVLCYLQKQCSKVLPFFFQNNYIATYPHKKINQCLIDINRYLASFNSYLSDPN